MKSKIFYYNIQIHERHLDVFSHVNNSVYMQFYEEARWDILNILGYGLDYIQKNKQGPVLLESHISFKKELVNREKIQIETYFDFNESKIFKIKQRILKESGIVSSEAEFVVGYLNLLERKLIALPQDWLDKIHDN